MKLNRREFILAALVGMACNRKKPKNEFPAEFTEQQLPMPRTAEPGHEPPQVEEVDGKTATEAIKDMKTGGLQNFENRFRNRIKTMAENSTLSDEQIDLLTRLIFNAIYQVQADRRTVLVTFQGQFVDKQGAKVPIKPLVVSFSTSLDSQDIVDIVCRHIINSSDYRRAEEV